MLSANTTAPTLENHLAPDLPLWASSTLGALQILSLDMIVHKCHDFYQTCSSLSEMATIFDGAIPKDSRIDDLAATMGYQCIQTTLTTLATLDITDGGFHRIVWDVLNDLELAKDPAFAVIADVRANRMSRDFKRIRTGLSHELAKHKFVYIPSSKIPFFHADELLGSAVHERFPEITQDAKDAGNCIAAELYTAAIFHLMRIAEFGLRALAKQLRVKVTHKKLPMPITEADWQTIIDAIRRKLDALHSLPRGMKSRRLKLERWSDASDHCLFMKDLWRNNISHNRKPYMESEALTAFGRVRDFMGFLANSL